MTERLKYLKKHLGFIYAEFGLVTGKVEMVVEITRRLGGPLRLIPYLKGHGWGLKYLVIPEGASGPTHLVKAASRVIERRVARDPAGKYYPYYRRFAREAEILAALADIGLGPSILCCEACFFVREYLPGHSLRELPHEQLIIWLPRALEALEKACEAGIFHSDPNAGNVIVDLSGGRLAFIDSEVAVEGTALGRITPERRLFCHERLLATAGRDSSGRPAGSGRANEELARIAGDFYGRHESVGLAPERAAALLLGEESQMRRPA